MTDHSVSGHYGKELILPRRPHPPTSKRGRNGEEPAAFLRVWTGQKALRAGEGRFFKTVGEREKN